MLHGHGDHVEPYDNGDEQVQVVAGANGVDEPTGGGVVGEVGLALSFCWKLEVVVLVEGRGRRGQEQEEGEVRKGEIGGNIPGLYSIPAAGTSRGCGRKAG